MYKIVHFYACGKDGASDMIKSPEYSRKMPIINQECQGVPLKDSMYKKYA
jgi:hypothetical protein